MPTGARTATRIRRPKRDKLDPTPVGAGDELPMRGLIVLPREAFEQGRGWVTYEGWDIFVMPSSKVDAPPRAYADGDVLASDLIELDGVEWQVDGPPAPYDKGSSRRATRIRVKRVGSA